MTKTYITSTGEVLVDDIPGVKSMLLLREPGATTGMFIDNRIIDRLVNNGSFKLKK